MTRPVAAPPNAGPAATAPAAAPGPAPATPEVTAPRTLAETLADLDLGDARRAPNHVDTNTTPHATTTPRATTTPTTTTTPTPTPTTTPTTATPALAVDDSADTTAGAFADTTTVGESTESATTGAARGDDSELAADRYDLNDILAQIGDGSAEEDAAFSAPPIGSDLADPREIERPKIESVVIASEGGIDFDPSFASFGKRAVGVVIDTVVLNLAMLPGFALIALGSSSVLLVVLGALIALVGLLAIIYVSGSAVASTGQWIGNKVTGTRVVNGVNGSNLTRPNAISRMALRHLVSSILFAGYLVALGDSQRRAFHDKFVDSVVVGRAREVWVQENGPNARRSQR